MDVNEGYRQRSPLRGGRALVVTAVASAVAGTLVTVAWRMTSQPALELAGSVGSSHGSARVWTLDHLMADLASALALVAAIGLATTSALAVTATLATTRAPTLAAVCSRLSPRGCRRLVAVMLGVGLATPATIGQAALAVPHPAGPPGHPVCGQSAPSLRGLGYPDLPSSLASRPRPVSARQVVVRPGDSLWRIAERLLPADASDAGVARLTWRLYTLNRATVGNDPDLILPGTTLLTPEGTP